MVVIPVVAILGLATPSFGANSYGSQPGYSTAIASSGGCAGAGAFGAFGPGNSWAGGANGPLTGFYNSNNCGSPQGTP